MDNPFLQLIRSAAERAIDGELTDSERVLLYRLALTVAASELHRLAELSSPVSPEALLLLQQIGLLCDEDVTADRLLGGMGIAIEQYEQASSHDGGAGE